MDSREIDITALPCPTNLHANTGRARILEEFRSDPERSIWVFPDEARYKDQDLDFILKADDVLGPIVPGTEPSEFKYRVVDYLDYFRLHIQRHSWKWLGSNVDRYFPRHKHVDPMWHILNDLNRVYRPRMLNWNEDNLAIRPKALDCILANTSPHWAHLLAYSEHWIAGLIIWLRENGVISNEFIQGEQDRMKIPNLVPLPNQMGCGMEVEKGYFGFCPTKKGLWRMINIIRDGLWRLAMLPNSPLDDYNPSKVLEEKWTESQAALGRGEGSFLMVFGQEYNKEQLSQKLKETSPNKHNLFEFHWLFLKSTKPKVEQVMQTVYTDKEGLKEQEVKIVWGRKTHSEKPYNNMENRKLPQDCYQEITRGADDDDHNDDDALVEVKAAKGQTTRGTTDKGRGRAKRSEGRSSLQIGPTMFAPFDPIVAVFVFWKMVHRLCYLEGYRLDHNLNELMQLSNYFLRLVQCQKPVDVYNMEKPACFTESPLELPKNIKVEHLNHNSRRSYRFKDGLDGNTPEEIREARLATDPDARYAGQNTRGSVASKTTYQGGRGGRGGGSREEHGAGGGADSGSGKGADPGGPGGQNQSNLDKHTLAEIQLDRETNTPLSSRLVVSQIYPGFQGLKGPYHHSIDDALESQSDYWLTPAKSDDIATRSSSDNYRILGRDNRSGSEGEELWPSDRGASECSDNSVLLQCQTKNPSKDKVLALLEKRLAEKTIELQYSFDRAVEQMGMFEALEQQRINAMMGPDDYEIGRLWTELNKVDREGTCNSRCFDQLRGIQQVCGGEEDAECDRSAVAKDMNFADEAAQLKLQHSLVLRWCVKAMSAEPPVTPVIEWRSPEVVVTPQEATIFSDNASTIDEGTTFTKES